MAINLEDVLSQETKMRPEVNETQPILEEKPRASINTDDFDMSEVFPDPLSPSTHSTTEVIEEENEDTVTPEESAESLITIIDVIQSSIFTFIGSRKIKKKYPEEVMERFIAVDIKDMSGEELDADEQRLLNRYRDFERRYDKLAGEMPFTDVERQKLMPAALIMCRRNNIKINTNVAFAVAMVDVLSKRAIKVFGA